MTQWYYQLLGEEFGPVSESSLRRLLIDGTLGNSDQVRKADSGDWMPLSAASINLSDVAQELSELNFQFEESAAPATARKPGSAMADSKAGPSQYYYQFFGQTLGPIPLDTLIRMAEAGRLQETDLVRMEEDFLWQAASEFSELSAAFLLRMPAPPAAAAKPVAATAPEPAIATPPPSADSPAPTARAVTTSAPAAPPQSSPDLSSGMMAATGNTATPAAPAPASAGTSKTSTAVSGAKAKGGRGKKKDRQAEEKLVDNILSEVFSEDEDEETDESASAAPVRDPAPARPMSAVAAATATTTTTEPSASPTASLPLRTWGNVGMSSQPSNTAAAAAAARPALRSAPKSKSSSGGSWLPDIQLELNGPVLALLGLSLLAAIWFGYTPLMRYFKTDESRYIRRMELAIETCEKLNPVTDAAKFQGQQDQMKREFGAYVAIMTEAGSTRQSAKNCLGALQRMMDFSTVDPRNTVLQKKLLDEAKSLIKKYKGE